MRSERFYKVRAGLKSLEGRTSAVKLNNLSALEINMIRSFFIKTLNAYQRYDISEVDWRNEQSHSLNSAQTPQGTPARGNPARYAPNQPPFPWHLLSSSCANVKFFAYFDCVGAAALVTKPPWAQFVPSREY